MSFLFNIENNVCKPKEEVLLVEPFRTIWEKSKDKSEAIRHFTVIELYTSKLKSNPYSGYDDVTRIRKLTAEQYGVEMDYNSLPKLVKEGIVKLNEIQSEGSPTYTYYLSQLRAVEKLKEFFLNFDLNERNEKGMLIYKPKEITSALADADKITQNLTTLRDKIDQELFSVVRNKAGREPNRYEQ